MKDTKLFHYPENCIGCNACVLNAPLTWQMNDETGKSELIHGKVKGKVCQVQLREDEIESNIKAAEACPMRIIKVGN